MNEQLIVKNFGPIKDATVDFKRVTVFIGPTGGGKSTLAKLAAIFRDRDFLLDTGNGLNNSALQSQILDYDLKSFLDETTNINWKSESSNALFSNNTLHLSNNDDILGESRNTFFSRMAAKYSVSYEGERLKELENTLADRMNVDELRYALKNVYSKLSWIYYIPAERVFLSAISGSFAGLTSERIALPKTLLQFAEAFEVARVATFGKKHVFFQGVLYIFHEEQNKIILPSGKTIPLNEAASGIQSTVPMMTLIESATIDSINNNEFKSSFIVEEPELNLFPFAQQELLNWLIEKCIKKCDDLTITTHSPYILSSCNLLLEAYKVAQLRPDLEDEIAAIVPKACWLNPDEFAAYYVADGTVKPITDERTHLIGGNELDAVSGDISDSFRQLLRLKKQAV